MIHKTEKTQENRYSTGANLTGSPSVAGSFSVLDIHNIAQGSQLNQKASEKIYVSGAQVTIAAANKHTDARVLRVMLVQNRNPADTLDTTTLTDLYETEAFAPKTPDGLQGDANAPINRDVLRVLYDKRFVLKPATEQCYNFKLWMPIKRYWLYKTVANNNAIASGKTYLVVQSLEVDGSLSTNLTVYNAMVRLFYKNT